jgi:hypothetical protein
MGLRICQTSTAFPAAPGGILMRDAKYRDIFSVASLGNKYCLSERRETRVIDPRGRCHYILKPSGSGAKTRGPQQSDGSAKTIGENLYAPFQLI